MKNTKLLLVICIMFFFSCVKRENNEEFKNDIIQLKADNAKLKRDIDSLNENYIKPFEIYEKIVRNETDSTPDSIIKRYKDLIAQYPDSYWKHEAQRRMENIEKRRKFWSKEKGWDFDIPKKPSFDEGTISCPGC